MNTITGKKQLLFTVLLILVAIAGCARIFQATTWGAWAFSDSASYFSAARNIMEGKGLTIQKVGGGTDHFQLFPPFYPIALGITGWVFNDFQVAARWINIAAFGLFLFLCGWALYRSTRNAVLSLIAPVLLLVSPMMLTNFTGAMSEPLFLMLWALAFLLITRMVEKPNSSHPLPFILANALLPVTRYAGIAFLFIHFCIMALFVPKPWKNRLVFATSVTLISALPIFGWFAYLYSITTRIGGRTLQVAAPFVRNFVHTLKVIYRLFRSFLPYQGLYKDILPTNVRYPLALALFVGLILSAVFLLSQRARHKEKDRSQLKDFLLYPITIIGFILFLGFAFSIAKRAYIIDLRQISPLIPMVILTSLYSLSVLLTHLKLPRVPSTIILVCLYGLVFRYYWLTSSPLVLDLQVNGYGYTARQYQESGIIDELKTIPLDRGIISNVSAFVLYYDNRLPLQVDHFPARMFGSGDGYGEKSFRVKQAALVILLPDFNNYYGERAAGLYAALMDGLEVAYQDAVGAIFYFPE